MGRNNKTYDIIMAGYTALKGTGIIAEKYGDIIKEHFSGDFYNNLISIVSLYSIDTDAAEKIVKENLKYCDDADTFMTVPDRGGIFLSLWRAGEALNSGLSVELVDVPLRQETTVLTDYFDINPYELDATGCLLTALPKKYTIEAVESLRAAGIYTTVIGHTQDSNDRVVHYDGLTRYLLPEKRFKPIDYDRLKPVY